MAKVNENYAKLPGSYLFAEIARRTAEYSAAHPDANLKVAALSDDPTLVCIPMRKGDETATLRTAIDAAIDELRADGTLKALSEKYFGRDISTEE